MKICFFISLVIMLFCNTLYFFIARNYMKQPGANKSAYTMPVRNKIAFIAVYLSDLLFLMCCFFVINGHYF
jgi:ABC-type uncharacterized transport system permease subunit